MQNKYQAVIIFAFSIFIFLSLSTEGEGLKPLLKLKSEGWSYKAAYEKASQDLYNFFRNSDSPHVYVQINEILPYLVQIYAGIECRKRGLSGKDVNHAIVEGCLALGKSGKNENQTLRISLGNVNYSPLVILRSYTYNYFFR